MNKAVIYFGATGNEAADQMVMQVLEEYCTVNGYEVVAVISENARQEGMTFPMKFAFVGMAEVEDVDVVVTFMSDMVGDCEETIMDNIIMLGEHGITVETANDDMAGYYQKMEQAGQKEDNGIVSLADFMAVFFRRLRAKQIGGFMSKCCVICVGRNADRAADRIEAYAKKADFEIVETIFKDTKSVERLKFYIERDSIISILVSSIYDVSSDKDVVKGIMELAAEHGISINDESRAMNPLSSHLRGIMPDKKELSIVTFSSETVVFDGKGDRVVACPTEQEAVEYIRGQEIPVSLS